MSSSGNVAVTDFLVSERAFRDDFQVIIVSVFVIIRQIDQAIFGGFQCFLGIRAHVFTNNPVTLMVRRGGLLGWILAGFGVDSDSLPRVVGSTFHIVQALYQRFRTTCAVVGAIRESWILSIS
jgi:hypothetical protein